MNKLVSLKAPISVNIEATENCNLRCFFCFCDDKAYQAKMKLMPSHEKIRNIKLILERLAEGEVFEVRWFGGEFFTLNGWEELVSYGRELGFFMSFVSNGTLLTEKNVSHLAREGISYCSLSIHGSEKTHDRITQVNGSFKKAVNSIKLLTANSVEVAIIFTPNLQNLDQFEEFVEQMVNVHGVASVGVNRLFTSDRYQGLNLGTYLELFKKIERLNQQGFKVYFVDSFPLCLAPVRYWKYMVGCSQGVGFCQIDYLGNIKNCSSLSVNIGNIINESLATVWQNGLSDFRQLRHLPLSCRLCPTFCGGGCIASRTRSKNFIADEFLDLPQEEQPWNTAMRTLKNYANKLKYNSFSKSATATNTKIWNQSEVPRIAHKFKVRKEAQDNFLCMVAKKGIITLNETSYGILQTIDSRKVVSEIIRDAQAKVSARITQREVDEVLNIFAV